MTLKAPGGGRFVLQVFPFITRGSKRYVLRLRSNPAIQPQPPASYLGLDEMRVVARRAVRARFGGAARRVRFYQCRRLSSGQVVCVVRWRRGGRRYSRVLRVKETADRYELDFDRP